MNAIADQVINLSKTAKLVISAQDNSQSAMGELFEMYRDSVTAIAHRRLGDVQEAQELCQDVFVQAIEKIDQLRQPECFGGWIRSITIRMAINRMVRRKLGYSAEPELLEATIAERGTPVETAIGAENVQQLRDGLDRLGNLDRTTLTAFYLEGQSLAEMAVSFQAPIGTIKRRLHVARKRLAQQVEHMNPV